MKKTFASLLIFYMLQNIIAQTEYVRYKSTDPYADGLRLGIMGTEYSSPDVANNGDQFYNDWAYGEILLTNGDIITDIRLRYDKYGDQLLWLRDDFIPCILCKACIKGFNLFDNTNNIFASFVLKEGIMLPFIDDSADCFFQTLVKGEYSFFAFRKVSRLPDTFELADDTRYFVFFNDQYERIRLSLHDLLNVPFIDRKKMKSIIKENRLRLYNNEQQFILAIKLYNNQDSGRNILK